MFKIILNDTKKIIKKRFSFYFKNKDILIVGCSGIVGQYFMGFFLNLLKNNNSPKSITLISKNKLPLYLNFLKKIKKIKILKLDIDKNDLKKLKKYDCIIFSAGYAQPSKFLNSPIETINLNTTVLNKFIFKLKNKGKFLYMSSSEIYNKNFKKNLTEADSGNTNTNDHRACYIEAKRCGETILNIYRNNYNIDAKSIRLCLAYGPGSKIGDTRALFQFIERSINSNYLKINDTGSSKRKYIYILDALIMMLNILVFGKNTIYNVAGKKTITIKQLAKKIADIFKIKLITKKNNALLDSPENISLSVKRYESEFGKINYTKISAGLIKTIKWYKLVKSQTIKKINY
jgi:nucleoside-diphosphate-sugar epimerase